MSDKNRLHKKQQYKVAAEERKFALVQLRLDHPKLYMFVGYMGTGVGSSIKGHLRFVGNRKMKIHSHYTDIQQVDEPYTSQYCIQCYNKVIHPKLKKTINGKEKSVYNNGTALYININCPSYRVATTMEDGTITYNNYSSQPRDRQSATAIAVAGTHKLLTRQSHPLFHR